MDKSCAQPNSKFFPFCGDEKDFFVHINHGKDYFHPTLRVKKIDFTTIKKIPYFTLDTEVILKDKKIVEISQLKEKTEIYCPFCDHKKRGNPESINASIECDDNGVPHIFCSSCQSRDEGFNGVYHLNFDESYKIQSNKNGTIIFRDIITDKFFLGARSKRTDEYEFNPISKQNIHNALLIRNMSIPKTFPEVEYTYDFTNRGKLIDIENGFINRYIAPILIKDSSSLTKYTSSLIKYTSSLIKDTSSLLKNTSNLIKDISSPPPTIEKTMMHFLGEDIAVFNALINHLAHMVQTGEKLRVSFLFQGVQGTGKGIWFNQVIANIFGRDYCTQIQQRSFMKVFNGWLENNYCLLVDEVEADFNNHGDEFARVLKQIIGDRCIAIESKGIDIKNGEINANLFFATNKRNGLMLEQSDRRFIIGKWQEKNIFDMPWWKGDNEIAQILINETEDFVAYLQRLTVDETTLNRVVKNDARDQLIEFSKTNTLVFFEKLIGKNWDWMSDNLIKPTDLYIDPFLYKESVDILKNIKNITKISREDIRILYTNIFQTKKSPHQFTKLCKLHGVNIKQMKINGQNIRGVALG